MGQARPNGARPFFLTELRTTPRLYDADRAPGPARKFHRPMMTGGALSTSTPREGARDPRRRLTRGPVLPRTGSLLIPPNWRVRPRAGGAGQTATADGRGGAGEIWPVRSATDG
jgi:hypothetical protein